MSENKKQWNNYEWMCQICGTRITIKGFMSIPDFDNIRNPKVFRGLGVVSNFTDDEHKCEFLPDMESYISCEANTCT